ncbi:aspartate aminotransferase family protein [soil metagenome]
MSTGAPEATDCLLGVYRPADPLFVAGEGSWLIAEGGRRFLDFTSGIAVNALGYGDPDFATAIEQALDTGLVHTSNLFRTAPAAELAAWLVEHSFADRVFFCNSGAEAAEGAFKFARRWARANGGAEKHEIVAFAGSFHGRTFGALAATDRPAYREPFEPLLPGVRFAEVGEEEAVADAISRARTAAVVIEPIQGEGGVQPVPAGFLATLRELCDRACAALIFDEVQTGLGRTGELWAYERAGVVPDLLTIAKPLAGGLPMGAVLLSERIAGAVQPGDHASTFGGGPLVASVALAVCRRIADPAFLQRVRRRGEVLARELERIERHHSVVDIRGIGLIWGIEVTTPAGDIVERARDAGVLLCTAGPNVIRLLPPLTVAEADITTAVRALEACL